MLTFGNVGSAKQQLQNNYMGKFVTTFLFDEAGQDLMEYSLLIVFVVLASAGIFLGTGNSIGGIVSTVNSELIAANTSAS